MTPVTLPPISARLPVVLPCPRTPAAPACGVPISGRHSILAPGIAGAYAIATAVDDRTEADAFAVRWTVYCHELGYEPEDRFPAGREFDGEDLRSVQVVVYHRATDRPVGCLRLVLADPQDPATPFHLEEVCRGLAAGAFPAKAADRLGCAELSRFCIIESHRRHDAADPPPDGMTERQWAAEAPHRRNLPALLWLAAAAIAVRAGLDRLYALMDPRLEFLSRALGLSFTAIGGPVQFRGTRVPYRTDRGHLRAMLQAQADPGIAAMLERVAQTAIAHPILAPYVIGDGS